MANDLKVKITADVKGFKSDIQSAGKSIDQFDNQTQETNNTIADYQSKLSKSQMGLKSFTREMNKARKDALSLSQAFNSLNPDEQISGFGKQLKAQMDEAIKKAGEMTDLRGDVMRQINNIASDTRGFDTMKESISLLSNSMGTLMSGYAALTGDQQAYNKAMATFAASQQVVNSLTAMQNLLQKESNVYRLAEAAHLKVINALRASGVAISTKSAFAIKREAVSQGLSATQTWANVAAHKALNMTLKAGPYIVIAAAIAAIGGAVAIVNKAIEKHKAKLQEQKEAYERSTLAARAYREATIQGIKDSLKEVVRMDLLRKTIEDTNRSYQDRKKAIDEVKKVVPEYHGSLTKEGNLINHNVDALDKYVNNIKEAAKSQAMFNKLVELYSKQLDEEDKGLKDTNKSTLAYVKLKKALGGKSPVGSKVIEKHEYMGFGEYRQDIPVKYLKLANGELIKMDNNLEKMNKDWRNSLDPVNKNKAAVNQYGKQIDKLASQIDVLNTVSSTTTVSSGKGTNNSDRVEEVKLETLSLKELQKQYDELKVKIKEAANTGNDIDLRKYVKEASAIKAEIDRTTDLMNTWKDVEIDPKIKENIKPVAIPVYLKLPDKIDIPSNYSRDLDKKLKIDELKKKAEGIFASLNKKSFISKKEADTAKQEIEAINTEIYTLWQQLSLVGQMEVKPKVEFPIDEEQQKSIENLKQSLEGLLQSAGGGVTEYVTKFTQLGDVLKGAQEGIVSPWLATISVMGLVSEAMTDVGQSLEDLGAGAGISKAAAIMTAITQILVGFSQAAATAGSLGPFGWIAWTGAAVGSLTTLLKTINSIKGYEHGGVIGGNSYHGDKILARLNSGERVLTKKQDDKLMKKLDSDRLFNGNVIVLDTRIEGSDIWLTQKAVGKTRRLAGKKQ